MTNPTATDAHPAGVPGRPRLVVLISGGGTNLQAILDAVASGALPADVVAVVSNRADAGGVARARVADVPAIVFAAEPGEERSSYDARLGELVVSFEPHWVVLAGWMRLLTMAFLGRFPGRVVNLHPAFPGELPGTRAIERAFEQYQAGRRTHTGVMVHLVPDEGVDDGPVLASTQVPILPDDTFDTLAERVHAAEHHLLVETLRTLCTRTTEETLR